MANNLQRKTNRNTLNVSQVEKEIRELRAENEYLKAVLDNKKYTFNKEKANLQTQLEDLKNKREAVSEICELKKNNETLAQEVEDAAIEVEELSEISAKLQRQLDEMKALAEENDNLQMQVEDLQNQGSVSSSHSQLVVEHEKISNNIVEMKHRLNELIKERDNARIQFDEARRKLEEAKQNLE